MNRARMRKSKNAPLRPFPRRYWQKPMYSPSLSPAKAGNPEISSVIDEPRTVLLGLHSCQPHKRDALYRRHQRPGRPRPSEHRAKLAEGFASKYDVGRLVYFESFADVESAIHREKRLKKWNRNWKIRLIEEKNPNWDDLFSAIVGD
jgi:predicted GIY-YIG superfamily endonuclease